MLGRLLLFGSFGFAQVRKQEGLSCNGFQKGRYRFLERQLFNILGLGLIERKKARIKIIRKNHGWERCGCFRN
jgi:hypothetical protein